MNLSKHILKWLFKPRKKPLTRAAQQTEMARQRAASSLLDEGDYDFWLKEQAKRSPAPAPAPAPATPAPAARNMTRDERFSELQQELKDKTETFRAKAKEAKKKPADVTKREKVRAIRPDSKKITQDVRQFLTEGEFRLKNQRDKDDFLERTGLIDHSEPRVGGGIIEAKRKTPQQFKAMQKSRRGKEGLSRGFEEHHMTAVKREFYTEILSPNPDMKKAARLLDELNPEFREQIERMVYQSGRKIRE